eukprot:1615139-Amphidinium_carterae.1
MLYLQLPKEGAKNAGERRPIGDSFASANVRHLWRRGALEETLGLAYLTEQRIAAGQHQAGVLLDCSKCYER